MTVAGPIIRSVYGFVEAYSSLREHRVLRAFSVLKIDQTVTHRPSAVGLGNAACLVTLTGAPLERRTRRPATSLIVAGPDPGHLPD